MNVETVSSAGQILTTIRISICYNDIPSVEFTVLCMLVMTLRRWIQLENESTSAPGEVPTTLRSGIQSASRSNYSLATHSNMIFKNFENRLGVFHLITDSFDWSGSFRLLRCRCGIVPESTAAQAHWMGSVAPVLTPSNHEKQRSVHHCSRPKSLL